MGQPDIQKTFSSISVEGFDQIYQPVPAEAQSAPEQVQPDPILEAQTDTDLEIQPDPSQGVSLEEAAKVFGLHIDTVRKRLQKRKINGFKIADKFGDKWFVHKDEVDKARTIQPSQAPPIQAAPEQSQPQPLDQTHSDPEQAQTDPIVDVEISLGQQQSSHQASFQTDFERERLMQIIESQAHQLKAAGDVIMYLRSEVDDAKSQVKLLTDSQHIQPKGWSRFWSWFVGR
ncbi:MAG: helix-turn-helix domain-containing protein [Candidatus Melainabacteria bacterium]|nr:helix-turn-helix domain-containing protein [Candidatus Melainabacteria bacterium]